MEKTIDLNQSQTVNDITVTLESIELTATGVTVYAFGTLPGYNSSQELGAFAEYHVDGGVVKQAGSASMRFLENGTKFIWQGWRGLDPIPSDAKELVFRIKNVSMTHTRSEIVEGPWEFRIPLE